MAPSTTGRLQQHQSLPGELPEGPISSLTHALTTRPKLRTFCTLLPSLWNESILRISSNPNLECIVLGDGSSSTRLREQTHVVRSNNFEHDGSYGIVGSGLFLMQARKHARLSDLIRAGTYVFFLFSFYYTLLIENYIDPSCALVHKLLETHPLHLHLPHVLIHQLPLILIASALIITYHRDHLHHHHHHRYHLLVLAPRHI